MFAILLTAHADNVSLKDVANVTITEFAWNAMTSLHSLAISNVNVKTATFILRVKVVNHVLKTVIFAQMMQHVINVYLDTSLVQLNASNVAPLLMELALISMVIFVKITLVVLKTVINACLRRSVENAILHLA